MLASHDVPAKHSRPGLVDPALDAVLPSGTSNADYGNLDAEPGVGTTLIERSRGSNDPPIKDPAKLDYADFGMTSFSQTLHFLKCIYNSTTFLAFL